ncbi:hypothetical protein ARALYDRAFT_918135 [Arabidopsis lyrata subsp. lyrata]|uniref:CASP-like protein n=1 Tax=Arabidopsis lyrata subsp. lyrata TaxID=81972 RepID=D7MQW4_ARALL|nr:hypothetical protein ARALYDRAFT_918135 [Arabidopsis lyrata subsp. lyrata]
MVTSGGFFSFTAFCYLIAAMGLQVIWSFGLAILDTFALVRKKTLLSPVLVSNIDIVISRSIIKMLIILYFGDLGSCSFEAECWKYQLSVALAFLCWITVAITPF